MVCCFNVPKVNAYKKVIISIWAWRDGAEDQEVEKKADHMTGKIKTWIYYFDQNLIRPKAFPSGCFLDFTNVYSQRLSHLLCDSLEVKLFEEFGSNTSLTQYLITYNVNFEIPVVGTQLYKHRQDLRLDHYSCLCYLGLCWPHNSLRDSGSGGGALLLQCNKTVLEGITQALKWWFFMTHRKRPPVQCLAHSTNL